MTVVNVTDAALKGTVTGPTFTGNVDGARFTGSVTYTNPPPVETTVSLFTTQKPALLNASDGASVTYELGVKFKSTSAGTITGLRFWKGDKEVTGHTGNIWSATGTRLASVTFANETASGWQVAKLAAPLSINANTTYIASVGTSNSYFCTTEHGLDASVSTAPLSTLVGSNGLYGVRGSCPTQASGRNNNYFRDVLFVAGATPPPTPTGDWPDASNSGIPPGTALTAYTGPMNISTPGTIVENKTINGGITISADNVTLRNCHILATGGSAVVQAEQRTTFKLINCKLVGDPHTGNGVLGSGTMTGNDISHTTLGIQLTSGASTVRGNFIHDLGPSDTGQPEGPHYDGITALGGQNHVIIEDNTVSIPPGQGGTAVIFIDNDFGSANDIVVRHNLLQGLRGPAHTFQLVQKSGHSGTLTNIVIDNNYMEPGSYGFILQQDVTGPVTITNNFDWNGGNPIPLTWPF